jgi:hypothetical protein
MIPLNLFKFEILKFYNLDRILDLIKGRKLATIFKISRKQLPKQNSFPSKTKKKKKMILLPLASLGSYYS